MFQQSCRLAAVLAVATCTNAMASAPGRAANPPATAPAKTEATTAPTAAARVPVSFPDTPGGRALQDVYKATDLKKVTEQLSTLRELKPEDREPLEPVILAIIASDPSDNAFYLGFLLSEWDPKLAATAPEFRQLAPAIARGLRIGIPEEPDSSYMNALGSAFLLARLNLEIAKPLLPDIDVAFNAPVKKPIEGESPECWSRYVLSHLLSVMGEPAVPILVQGLAHGDRWVRKCAVEALAATQEPPFSAVQQPMQMVGKTAAARKAASQASVLLWDENNEVRSAAAKSMGTLRTPDTLNPRERDRLLELLAIKNADDANTRSDGGAVSALAALHPAATPSLLTYIQTAEHPRRNGAIGVFQEMGAPAVAVLAPHFADDPQASPENAAAAAAHDVILKKIGSKAIPGLAKIAREDSNPRARERARQLLAVNVADAHKEVNRMLGIINSTSDNPEAPTAARIKIILEHACVADAAIPAFQKLAQSHPDETVRKTAADAITQINKEKVDLP